LRRSGGLKRARLGQDDSGGAWQHGCGSGSTRRRRLRDARTRTR
jgi:hypothetical protein